MTESDNTPAEVSRPPYVPFPTFSNFIKGLKERGVPGTMDRTTMHTLSGTTQSQLTLALRFFGLIDQNLRTQPALERLVAASGTPDWAGKMEALLQHGYGAMLKEIDLGSASRGEVLTKIKEIGGTEGSVAEKAMRFLLKLAEEAGRELSGFLATRRGRPSGSGGTRSARRKPRKPARPAVEETSDGASAVIGEDQWSLPIPLRDGRSGQIIVPRKLTKHDFAVLKMVVATLELHVDDAGEA